MSIWALSVLGARALSPDSGFGELVATLLAGLLGVWRVILGLKRAHLVRCPGLRSGSIRLLTPRQTAAH